MLKNLRIKRLLFLTVLALAFVGCSSSQAEKPNTETEFSAMDLMFAVMMIPHHEQATVMAALALENSNNEKILDLAQRIKDGQALEITQMQGWLDKTGVSSDSKTDDHAMHGGMMGGMATEEEIEELSKLSSPEFDLLFLDLMILHHEGAIQMVEMIQNSANPEVKKLSQDIIEVQNSEIQEMKNLRTAISGD